jgi:ADP-heptose:LPS heptosyltransferase
MSVPTLLQSTIATMPCTIPYIFAAPHLVEKWKKRIAHDKNFKIGIAWQPDLHNDISRLPIARRGIPLELFKKYADLPNITWYCLQQKEGLEQIKEVENLLHFVTWDESFDVANGPFMDTAALMENLDLIITTDSAVAHVAGALGRPTFLLLPFSTDWRWLTGKKESPWYPSMKIFKQLRPFDWYRVIDDIYQELCLMIPHV